MSGSTTIEWATASWNPLTGCSRVSEGCAACYAFTLHDRRHQAYIQHSGIYPKNGKAMPRQYARPFSVVQLLPERLHDPLHIRTPQRFFVNSMGDVFHSQVPEDYIRQLFASMEQASWHTFLILTKRPGRLRQLWPTLPWPPNIWIGLSIELDKHSRRADVLRIIPASVRFLSCEPLLGPLTHLDLTGIQWVIAGGESGTQARPMNIEWATDLRDRCLQHHIAFFFKQVGGRTPKAGGRLLEGREWNEFPPRS